jgi:hypothetical protein
MKTFVVIATAGLIVAIILTGITSVFNYLAAVSAVSPKCAGRTMVEGYRIGLVYLLSFPLASALIAFVIGRSIWSERAKEKAEKVLEIYNLPVFKFASIEITLGMSLFCSALITILLSLGVMTGISAARYDAIAKYCLAGDR